ncbi:MAG: TonB-dependent receptor [Treponema sp.]|nr:TonB-dependent receptor [Treponema sp.]
MKIKRLISAVIPVIVIMNAYSAGSSKKTLSLVEYRQTFTQEDISRQNAKSLPDFLTKIGICSLSLGAYGQGTAVIIRGMQSPSICIVLDGVILNSTFDGEFDYYSINIASVEKLEIVRGGFTESVGAGTSSTATIYITTKKNADGFHFSGDVFAKTYFSSKAPLDAAGLSIAAHGLIDKSTSYHVYGRGILAENAFRYKTENKWYTNEDTEVKDGNLGFTVSHKIKNGHSWFITDNFYAKNMNPGSGSNYTQKNYDNSISITYSIPQFMDALNWDTTWSWISNHKIDDQGNEDENPNTDLNTFTLTTTAEMLNSDIFHQGFGLSLAASTLNSTHTGGRYFLPAGTFKSTTEFFLNDTFSLSAPIALMFSGLNLDFAPKLGLKAATDYIDVIIAGYRMVRFPTIDELYQRNYGNKSLQPEEGIGGELSVNMHDVIFPCTFTVFADYYTNKISWEATSSDSTVKPRNLEKVLCTGFTLTFQKQFTEWLLIRGTGDYTYAQKRDCTDSSEKNKRIAMLPDFTASLGTVITTKIVNVTADFSFTGSRYIDSKNTKLLDPYILFNAGAELTALKIFKPYIRVDNIFNKSYEIFYGSPAPNTSLTIGTKAEW